jgi:hypothetical protein
MTFVTSDSSPTERLRAICNEYVQANGVGASSDWLVSRLLPIADDLEARSGVSSEDALRGALGALLWVYDEAESGGENLMGDDIEEAVTRARAALGWLGKWGDPYMTSDGSDDPLRRAAETFVSSRQEGS